jgi:hypothetical protein
MKSFYALALVTCTFALPVQAQVSAADIWANGLWFDVSETDKLTLTVDLKNLKASGPTLNTYIAFVDKEKKQYTGPFEFVINCQQTTYKMGSRDTIQWDPKTAGGIAATKLCGDVSKVDGDKYEFLASFVPSNTKIRTDQYWVPKNVVRDSNHPDVLIVKVFYSHAAPPLDFEKPSAALAEVNCQKSIVRFSFGTVGKLSVDLSKEWSPLVANNPMYLKICANNALEVKSSVAEPVGIESAKAKCEDLGFKKGTERFGQCVLQLIK